MHCTASTSTPGVLGALRYQGVVTQVAYNREGNPREPVISDSFTLDVDPSGKWLLTSNSTIFTDGIVIAGFDGTSLITVMYNRRIRTSATSGEYIEFPDFKQGRHLAMISPGDFPHDLFPPSRVAWMALASHPPRDSSNPGENSEMATPWLEARHDLLAFAFKATLKHAPDWPHALISADFIADPQNMPDEPSAYLFPTDLNARAHRPKPGTLAATFRTEGPRPIGEKQVYDRFNLDIHWAGVGVAEPNGHLAQRFSGSITKVESIPPVTGIPEAVGAITVRDFRLRYRDKSTLVQQLRYKITDGNWREIDHPELQAMFNHQKERRRRGGT